MVVLRPVCLGNVGRAPVVAVQDVGLAARAQQELQGSLQGSRWVGPTGVLVTRQERAYEHSAAHLYNRYSEQQVQ